MAIGIITGTGTYALPGFADARPRTVATRWGEADVTTGRLAGVDVVHLSRHGEGHPRLSGHVTHRANIAALRELGVHGVLATTACGSCDPALGPGSLVAFDDLHFPVNRLPDGSLCTFHDTPGEAGRGHWIYGDPFSAPLRRALVEGADAAGVAVRDGGVYGHVDGPRFNTRTEVRQLTHAGVTAVSQTAGPETVLCGEAELPFALMGFATDYANGVAEPTPVEELVRLMGESTGILAGVLRAALARIDQPRLAPTGVVYRFD